MAYKKQVLTTLGLCLSILAILPGCTKSHRKHLKQVKAVEMPYLDYQATQEQVTLSAQRLDAQGYKHVLRKTKLSRFDRKTTAIKLSITNYSNTPVLLNKEGIALELLPYTSMVKTVRARAMWQGIGISLGMDILGGSLIAIGRSTMPLISLVGGAIMLARPFVSHKRSANVGELNGQNKMMLKQMMLEEPVIIAPKETQTRVLFVSNRNYEPEFGVTLTNVENQKQQLYFTVELEPYL